jgi:hypothetical protein
VLKPAEKTLRVSPYLGDKPTFILHLLCLIQLSAQLLSFKVQSALPMNIFAGSWLIKEPASAIL